MCPYRSLRVFLCSLLSSVILCGCATSNQQIADRFPAPYGGPVRDILCRLKAPYIATVGYDTD